MGELHLRSRYYPYFSDFKNVKELVLDIGEIEASNKAGLAGILKEKR